MKDLEMTSHSLISSTKKKGFTLIELSIVLVIISLIVGGIVGGRSLIESARLHALGQEINTLRMATRTFFNIYDYWPGDLPDGDEYWPGLISADGNGNGRIDCCANNESRDALESLFLAELIPWNSQNDTRLFSEAWSASGYQALYGTGGFNGAEGNIFQFAGYTPTQSNPTAALIPKHAKNIDIKIDDGILDKGSIHGDNGQGLGSWACIDQDVWTNTGTRAYNVDQTERMCRMYIWMF